MADKTNQGSEKTQLSHRSQRVKISLNVTAMVLLAVALALLVNYLSMRHYSRSDWTETGFYTLSDESKTVLGQLQDKLKIIVLMTENPEFSTVDPRVVRDVKELVGQYAEHSDKVEVELLDVDRDLARAQMLADKYKIQETNVVVFEHGARNKYVTAGEMAEMDYGGYGQGQAPTLKAFKGEEVCTQAIINVIQERQRGVCLVTGHGERGQGDFDGLGFSQAAQLLKEENVKVEELATLGKDAVPETCDMVAVVGPQKGFTPRETALLDAYLKEGGKALVLLDPVLDGSRFGDIGIEGFLGQWGAKVGQDVVIDPTQALPFIGAETLFVSNYGAHEAVARMKSLPSIFPLARSVSRQDREGVTIAELLRTSEEGWGETDIANTEGVAKDERDVAGPVTVGLAITRDTPEGKRGKQARLVVVGDSDFATNHQVRNVGNRDLFRNLVGWLSSTEGTIVIGSKMPNRTQVTLSSEQMSGVFMVTVAGMPLLTILLGIAVWWRRRS